MRRSQTIERLERRPEQDAEVWLRTGEVARLFGVSERAVFNWAEAARLPYQLTAGGHRRFAAEDVLNLYRSSLEEAEEA